MYFHSFADFIHMGGHAFYVWTAYGITLVMIVVHIVMIRRRHRQVRADIRRALRRESVAAGDNESEMSS